MKVLDLPLKAKWYEMIACGEKLEEYREIKPYWCKRLAHCDLKLCWWRDQGGLCQFKDHLEGINRLGYTHVRFRYGYTRKTMTFEIKDIVIGDGKPEWGAEKGKEYFVIKLGRLI